MKTEIEPIQTRLFRVVKTKEGGELKVPVKKQRSRLTNTYPIPREKKA